MADPISIVFAVTAAANFALSAFHLAAKFQSSTQATRLALLYAQFKIQHRRTQSWVRRMEALKTQISLEDLRAIVTKEDEPDVLELCARIRQGHQEMEKHLKTLDQVGTKAPGALTARLKLATGGFEQCKEVLEYLKTMNDLLYDLAPPVPPAYTSMEHRNTAPVRTSRSQSVRPNAFDMRRLIEGDEEEEDVEAPAEYQAVGSSHLGRTTSRRPENEAEALSIKPVEGRQVKLKTSSSSISILGDLYNRALTVMHFIAIKAASDEKIMCIASRLRTWGWDLFSSTASSDTVLFNGSETRLKLARMLQTSLIEILLLQVQELMLLGVQSEDSARKEIQHMRDDIRLHIFQDEHLDLTIECSESVLYDLSDNLMLSIDDELDEKLQLVESRTRDIYSVGDIVEDLFDLLPELRSIRQQWCLEKESNVVGKSEKRQVELENTSRLSHKGSLPQKDSLAPTDRKELSKTQLGIDIGLQLSDIKAALQKRDAQAKEPKAKLLESAMSQDQGLVLGSEEQLYNEVQRTIDSFIDGLSLSGSTVMNTPDTFPSPGSRNEQQSANKLRTMQLYDQKLPLDKATDSKIDGFIKDVNNSYFKLRSTSGSQGRELA